VRRWIGILFAIGSACFVVGPAPGFVQLVGSAADGTVFFVGSIFFTLAAFLQFLDARRPSLDWWAALIQLAGTVYFNVSTFEAMQDSYETSQVDRLVWRPELFGSICFLVSGVIAYRVVRGGEHTREWKIGAVNLLGCILFMVSALAGYVVPETGDVLDLAAANLATALGAVCFLIGALMLLPKPAEAGAS
jgi:exosortase/archaeosortase